MVQIHSQHSHPEQHQEQEAHPHILHDPQYGTVSYSSPSSSSAPTATAAAAAAPVEQQATNSDATAGGSIPIDFEAMKSKQKRVKKKLLPGGVPSRNDATNSITNDTTAGGGGGGVLEVIPDLLYFATLGVHPKDEPGTRRYVCTDSTMMYTPYFADFGPLNICLVVHFCRLMRKHLPKNFQDVYKERVAVDQKGEEEENVVFDENGKKRSKTEKKPEEIVYYCGHDPHKRANAAMLLASFWLLELDPTRPRHIWKKFQSLHPALLPFRDAAYSASTFDLTIYDCLKGLAKANELGWINIDTFDTKEYEDYEQVDNGDWNWIIPDKFIAFSGPIDGTPWRSVQNVLKPFRERHVRLVIRLNEKKYDATQFRQVGIHHEELEFPDGSNPPDSVINTFLKLVEGVSKGVTAVHCKAGLGRTGTLIGIYAMKHYGFDAREFIAWARLCRPGSVIHSQQQFLESVERRFCCKGNLDYTQQQSLVVPQRALLQAQLGVDNRGVKVKTARDKKIVAQLLEQESHRRSVPVRAIATSERLSSEKNLFYHASENNTNIHGNQTGSPSVRASSSLKLKYATSVAFARRSGGGEVSSRPKSTLDGECLRCGTASLGPSSSSMAAAGSTMRRAQTPNVTSNGTNSNDIIINASSVRCGRPSSVLPDLSVVTDSSSLLPRSNGNNSLMKRQQTLGSTSRSTIPIPSNSVNNRQQPQSNRKSSMETKMKKTMIGFTDTLRSVHVADESTMNSNLMMMMTGMTATTNGASSLCHHSSSSFSVQLPQRAMTPWLA